MGGAERIRTRNGKRVKTREDGHKTSKGNTKQPSEGELDRRGGRGKTETQKG